MSLCIYALVPAGAGPPGVSGIAGERLSRIRVGTLDALVGVVTRQPRPTQENLRKYNRTIMALWRRNPALLPARFATCVRDRPELELILDSRQRSLRRRLREVRNRAQMTVRLLQGPPITEVRLKTDTTYAHDVRSVRLQPDHADSRFRGRSYLRARAARARDEIDVPELTMLRRAVRRWVRAEHVEKRDRIVSLYHLVPQSSVDRYWKAIEGAARKAGVRLLISGPWPAYAFAESV